MLREYRIGIDRRELLARAGFAADGRRAAAAAAVLEGVPLAHDVRAVCLDDGLDVRLRPEGPEICGIFLPSLGLVRCLGGVARVYPFIVTAGPGADAAAAAAGDALAQFLVERSSGLAVEQGAFLVTAELAARLGAPAVSSITPGCLRGWPVSGIPALIGLFRGGESRIGVTLGPGPALLPKTSVCGLMYPSVAAFSACSVCRRVRCPSRAAGFDPAAAAGFDMMPEDGPRALEKP